MSIVYITRGKDGKIDAVYAARQEFLIQEIRHDHPEVTAFLASINPERIPPRIRVVAAADGGPADVG